MKTKRDNEKIYKNVKFHKFHKATASRECQNFKELEIFIAVQQLSFACSLVTGVVRWCAVAVAVADECR